MPLDGEPISFFVDVSVLTSLLTSYIVLKILKTLSTIYLFLENYVISKQRSEKTDEVDQCFQTHT